MENDALGWLTEQLRDQPPPAVANLAAEHLTHLGDALRGARRRQAQQLQAASDQALDNIPRLLRGPVKRIVG